MSSTGVFGIAILLGTACEQPLKSNASKSRNPQGRYNLIFLIFNIAFLLDILFILHIKEPDPMNRPTCQRCLWNHVSGLLIITRRLLVSDVRMQRGI